MKTFYRLLLFAVILSGETIAFTQVPKLSSFPSAAATIFLDFDGQFVTGTSWNWSGGISALPAALNNSEIREIFNRVSEDYRPFNLNITTDSTVYLSAPFDQRLRLIITPTSQWYGKAGGSSYVGSFCWGNETPAWVFSDLLYNNVKYIAEACSHESGHTLGLQHQSIYDDNCRKIAEYNTGQGNGETGWAPIMGMGYFQNLTTWNTGPNTENCHSIQNDLQIIAGEPNNFGFRADDHGNNAATSTHLQTQGYSFNASGLINVPGDEDVFKIDFSKSSYLRLEAIPQNVGAGNAGADIDIELRLMDANYQVIGLFNPTALLNASIDTSLNAGIYYISVSGAPNHNVPHHETVGNYRVAGTIGVALPLSSFELKAFADKEKHVLNWSYNSDEHISLMAVEASTDGLSFRQVATVIAFSGTFTRTHFGNDIFYRVKATAADGRQYYSAIARVNDKHKQVFKVLGNPVSQQLICFSPETQVYQLTDITGRVLQVGRLFKGINRIDMRRVPHGIVLLRVGSGVSGKTEKLIKQ